MTKLVILTVELDEAEAARALLERMVVSAPIPVSNEIKRVFSFNAKLHKAVAHTKGAKRRV